MKNLWIAWERHRRTIELAKEIPDTKLVILEFNSNRFIRYPVLIAKTLLAVIRSDFQFLFVQSPSIVLALVSTLLSFILKRPLIVDAHNEALKPYNARLNFLLPFYRFVQKNTYITIVTNSYLADEVRANGGNPFILEDKIPQFISFRKETLKGTFNAALICTYEKDEPFLDVIQAAKLLPSEIYLYITGNTRKAPQHIFDSHHPNITFTGFLPEIDYISLLSSADVVIDLTRMQNCLVCGAYEAVSLKKPIILSDTKALRQYFFKGAVFTKNDPESIAQSIVTARNHIERLNVESSEIKFYLEEVWKNRLNTFLSLLSV